MRVGRGARLGFSGILLAGLLAGSAERGKAAQQTASTGALPDGGSSSLEQQVRAIVAEPEVARAHWGIAVATMDGTPLLSINAGQFFQPASTAKLFTTAAAMSLLGPQAAVTTRLVGRGVFASAAELRGDLVLIGAGDANLSGRTLPYVAAQPHARRPKDPPSAAEVDPLRHLAAMADAVAATGLKLVTGDVLGDDTLLPWEPYPEGWELEDLVWGYGAPVSALSVGDNQLRLTVTPGAHAGEPAAVELTQAVPYYVVEATATTAAPGSKTGTVQVERAPGSRVLRVYGQIAADAGADVEEVAIADPAEFAAMALKAMLETRGVEVRGRALAQHRYPVEARGFLPQVREPLAWNAAENVEAKSAGHAQKGCDASLARPRQKGPDAACTADKPLAEHGSPPLSEDVVVANKTSQNLHAELLLRALGLARSDDGSTAQGARVVRQFLIHAGISGDDFTLYDGSGLSGHDLVTPRAETALLVYAARQPWYALWKASLPVGGVDGTLEGRFVTEPLKGRVFAKTGTLGEARALAGYLECASGRTVVFAIMDSTHQHGSSADRSAMDRIVAAIAAAE